MIPADHPLILSIPPHWELFTSPRLQPHVTVRNFVDAYSEALKRNVYHYHASQFQVNLKGFEPQTTPHLPEEE